MEYATSAVAKYAKIMKAEPTWEWPIVCHRFACAACDLIQDPKTRQAEVLAICEKFEADSKGLKAIFDLWFLHDWLLNQITSPTSKT